MKVAVHHSQGYFSDRWISYCVDQGIDCRIVSCYDNDIMEQLHDVDCLLWHWSHNQPKDYLIARAVLYNSEMMGIRTFPNQATCWHFDDKIAQKYLLEAINAPLVPTYVFVNKQAAEEWLKTANYPIVFKLSRGAGSANVHLVKNDHEALKLVKQAFGAGFRQKGSYFSDSGKKIQNVRQRGDYLGVVARMPSAFVNRYRQYRSHVLEKNYLYFQDFVPGNQFDTRITVIGERAFAFTRDVRDNDFRASGSGRILYDMARIDEACIDISFYVSRRIGAQSLALDFVHDLNGIPLITEISYCFSAEPVYQCPGYWDESMQWHEGHYWPQDAILKDLLSNKVPACSHERKYAEC